MAAPPRMQFAAEGELQTPYLIQFLRTMEFVMGNLTDSEREG